MRKGLIQTKQGVDMPSFIYICDKFAGFSGELLAELTASQLLRDYHLASQGLYEELAGSFIKCSNVTKLQGCNKGHLDVEPL